MNLIKEIWTQKDIDDFKKYLLSFSKGEEKGLWEKRIVNTKLPCIAVPSKDVQTIVNEIAKGNFISFIDYWTWDNLTQSIIVGKLICKIKEFKTFQKYLQVYAEKVDNWAGCDCLKLVIKSKNFNDYFILATKMAESKQCFVRRIGVGIIFKALKNKEYLSKIFQFLNSFYEEKEYYVNMMLAWTVCECLIKYKDETLLFLNNNKLNDFVINKAISKCRDSFRLSSKDKEYLLMFKRNI